MIKLKAPLYQWDTDRYLSIADPVDLTITTIDFAHAGDSEALVVEPDRDTMTVKIPNILLQSSEILYVYERTVDDEGNRTVFKSRFNVRARERPSDYTYTETETITYEALEKRVAEIETDVGNLDDLTTETKADLVSAVNEIETHIGTILPWSELPNLGNGAMLKDSARTYFVLKLAKGMGANGYTFIAPEEYTGSIPSNGFQVRFYDSDGTTYHFISGMDGCAALSPFTVVEFSTYIMADFGTGCYLYIKYDENGDYVSKTLCFSAAQKDVLLKGSTNEYTPTTDYSPATKKYVDDGVTEATTAASDAATSAKAATESAASAETKATEAAASAKTAGECAQAMAGTFDFTGYLRYQIVTEVPETQEEGVLYIVQSA